jgi:hypothetical protein
MGRSSDEKGAEKAVAIRRSQQKERARLQSEIASEQKLVATISEERAPIAAEVRKVEAEVGPIKYIAKFIYGEHGADENMLEKSVTWIIILIVVVFDPLAVIMLLAAQMTFGWKREDTEPIEPVSISDFVPQPQEYIPEETKPEPFIPDSTLWPFPSAHELQAHTEEVTSETQPTVLTADTTVTATDVESEPEFPMPIEQWNAMIEEAEKQAEVEAKNKYQILPELQKHIDESTVEERVARGDSYIDTQGTEVNLEEESSKKKTYMTKDPEGRIITKNRP